MIEDYQEARKSGQRAYRRAVMGGRYPYLPALEEMVEGISAMKEVHVGQMEIPISMIAGTRTASRQSAFACNFMPLLAENSEFATKWSALYDSQVEEGIRDPIKVCEFMNYFYVIEGNKRVSVMKKIGAPKIRADVTRILPPKNGSEAVRIYEEFLKFYQVTSFYPVVFSKEGRYAELAELFGQDLEKTWPEDTLMDLRSAFDVFEECYRDKGGEFVRGTFGDAFLLYLKVYGSKELLEGDTGTVKAQIGKLWNEFLTENTGTAQQVMQTPEEAMPSAARATVNTTVHTIRSILRRDSYSVENPLRAVFIHSRSAKDSSWVYGHELGRQEMETNLGGLVETAYFEDCSTPEKAKKAFAAARADGAQIIFTTSPTLMEDSLRAAIEYPELRIMNCSINLPVNAVRTYYCRFYEAKFLMGALAACMTDDHRLGYIADYPIYGNIASINAFALGAAFVDPGCKVVIAWKSEIGCDPETALRDKGIRTISGADYITPADASRRYGLYRFEEDGQVSRLAMPVLHWGKYYELIIRQIIDGTFDAKSVKRDESLNYWWGLSSGVIDVILSEGIPSQTKRLLHLLKRDISDGRLLPFGGPLRAQKEEILSDEGTALTAEEIITMDWLCENVVGEIPAAKTLTEEARETVSVSGVPETKAK